MFADYSTEVIGFSSISRKDREYAEGYSQTSAGVINDQGTSTISVENTETQTSPLSSKLENVDWDALGEFLKRIEPLVMEELNIVVDFSNIDDEYNGVDETLVTKIEALAPPDGLNKAVSSLSWNSTGGTIAIGFSELRHNVSCHHESIVSIHTRGMHKPMPPKILDTATCVKAISFHPWEPSELAIGLCSGEVIVWEWGKEDVKMVEKEVEHTTHVVHVGWWSDVTGVFCLSAGADGRIILRKVSSTSHELTVHLRFLVTRAYSKSKTIDKYEGLEITCFSYLRDNECIVGVGGGGILRLALTEHQPATLKPNYLDPVTLSYQPHNAVVTAVKSSADGDTFATSSSDGELRIYSPSNIEPKWVVNCQRCLLDIFYTSIQSAIGVCGEKTGASLVRFATGDTNYYSSGLTGNYNATKAEFIAKRSMVAIGDSTGNVNVWKFTSTQAKKILE